MRTASAGDMPCMSWHWSGLIHTKLGTVLDARSLPKDFSKGTMLFRRGFLAELMSEKYMKGLCFCAYRLTVVPLMTGAYSPSKPVLGMDCMYAFQLRPFASSWSTMFFPLKRWGLAEALVACTGVRAALTVASPAPGTNSSGAHVTAAPALQSSQMPWKSPEIAER